MFMTQELGYYFHPSPLAHLLWHVQLDVHIYHVPTERHFDPERVEFPVVGLDGRIEHVTITHGWSGTKQYQVCVGRILMHDRSHKVAEAYSFGGDLTISNQADFTVCTLTSAAPILDLVGPDSMAARLVSEFEGHLAKCRACWGNHPTAGEKKLVETDPLTLFSAGLNSLQQAYESIPADRRSHLIMEEEHEVHELIALLYAHNLWPDASLNLEGLFAPSAS